MSSFLQKLKGKGLVSDKKDEVATTSSGSQIQTPPGSVHLDVDIFETETEIILYANVAGAHLHEMNIAIEGENDVVVIRGMTRRPDEKEGSGNQGTEQVEVKEPERKILFQECHWGSFFRQIILPEEIDVEHVDGIIKHGVLILKLPFIRSRAHKGKPKVITVKEE